MADISSALDFGPLRRGSNQLARALETVTRSAIRITQPAAFSPRSFVLSHVRGCHSRPDLNLHVCLTSETPAGHRVILGGLFLVLSVGSDSFQRKLAIGSSMSIALFTLTHVRISSMVGSRFPGQINSLEDLKTSKDDN